MSQKVRVRPHPSLAERGEYLPGVPAEGAELPDKEATDLIARGLAEKVPLKSPPKE